MAGILGWSILSIAMINWAKAWYLRCRRETPAVRGPERKTQGKRITPPQRSSNSDLTAVFEFHWLRQWLGTKEKQHEENHLFHFVTSLKGSCCFVLFQTFSWVATAANYKQWFLSAAHVTWDSQRGQRGCDLLWSIWVQTSWGTLLKEYLSGPWQSEVRVESYFPTLILWKSSCKVPI